MGIASERGAHDMGKTGTTADELAKGPGKARQSQRGEAEKGGSELKTAVEGRQGGKMEP